MNIKLQVNGHTELDLRDVDYHCCVAYAFQSVNKLHSKSFETMNVDVTYICPECNQTNRLHIEAQYEDGPLDS